MKKRLIALGCYSLFWLSLFFFGRLFFILVQYRDSFQFTLSELSATFLHGSKLDVSTIGYFLLIPILIYIPEVWFTGNWYRNFLRWYTNILISVSSFIIVSDANLYSFWGFRMDYTPVLYLRTPVEALASVSTFKLIQFCTSLIFMTFLLIYIYNKLIDRLFIDFPAIRSRMAGTLFFMFLIGALIIPIRGGFGLAPINAGTVYFSKKMFLNHTAINAVWNVGSSAFAQKPVKNPYEFGDIAGASELVDSLTFNKRIPVKILNLKRPNILLFVLESFSGYLIGPIGGDPAITPNFNRFIGEGIFFSDFYASGNRTDKALPAILDGYPAQPAQSIIKEPNKTQSLPGITKILNKEGYSSSFWYGGDINFANFNSFVIGSGFHDIVTKNDFNPSEYNSKWGVHDHILLGKLKDSMKVNKEPFFKVVLTLSSHEPFDIPEEPVFKGSGDLIKYKNSVFYVDKSLGAFIDWAKKTDWWKNTLVIMVADHCCRISSDLPLYSQEVFKIPMLWMGGALSVKGSKIDKLGSQVDIAVTLLNQLGLQGSFPFGKDLLSKQSKSFAFYTYNEGFAFITDSSAVIYDQKLKKTVMNEGKNPEYAENLGKAYLQVLFNDYLKR